MACCDPCLRGDHDNCPGEIIGFGYCTCIADHLCPFCGCCLWSECTVRPCPELVDLDAEIDRAPVITITGGETDA